MNIKQEFKQVNKKLDKIIGYTTVDEINDSVLQYTYSEWLDIWRELYKVPKVKEGTLYQIDLFINNFLKPSILGNMPLNKIDGITLQRYLISIKAPRQREHLFGIIRDSFSRAYTLQLITFNPTCSIELPKRQKKNIVALDRNQEQLFVESCKKDKYGYLYFIMLYAGLRKGEAQALLYSDIDLEKRVIRVNKTVNDLGHINTPKTVYGNRIVPIFDSLYPYLIKFEKNINKIIFPYQKRCVFEHFHSILNNAELSGLGITTHSLRHTFATRCAESGIFVKTVQKWLGHSTPQMTLSVYTHINNDFEDEQIALLNKKYNQ